MKPIVPFQMSDHGSYATITQSAMIESAEGVPDLALQFGFYAHLEHSAPYMSNVHIGWERTPTHQLARFTLAATIPVSGQSRIAIDAENGRGDDYSKWFEKVAHGTRTLLPGVGDAERISLAIIGNAQRLAFGQFFRKWDLYRRPHEFAEMCRHYESKIYQPGQYAHLVLYSVLDAQDPITLRSDGGYLTRRVVEPV